MGWNRSKIGLLWTSILVLFVLVGCIDEEVTTDEQDEKKISEVENKLDTSSDPIRAEQAEYTFMVFLNGTDLESTVDEETNEMYGAGSSDLDEMMKIGSSPDLNVIVQTGGTKQWLNEEIDPSQNQVWQVEEGHLTNLADLGNQNIGKPETLTNFIVWTIHNFPAEKYVLDLWNHGGGPLGGYGVDEVNDLDNLTLKELHTALQDAYDQTGVIFEVIGFDACLMASLEIAHTVSPFGKYLVASEELEPGHGWNYTPILDELTNNPSMDGAALGKVIADGFYKQAKEQDTDATVTLSVTDLSKVKHVLNALDDLMEVATPDLQTPSERNMISGSLSKAESYGGGSTNEGYSDLFDLGHFAKNLTSEYPEAELVLSAIKSAVVYKINGDTRQYGEGLSIYFPYKDKKNFSDNLSTYLEFDFSDDYGDFIQEYTTVSGSETNTINITDVSAEDDDVFTVQFSENEYENIEHIYSTLGYYIDEDETEILHLGMDNNVIYDPNTGIVKDNFTGYWTGLNGQLVSLNVKEETDAYNRYSIPVVLNGQDVNIIASWFWDDSKEPGGYYKIHGAWRGLLPESNMPDKNLISIKPGDEIIPLFEYTNEETDEEGLMEGDAFIVENELILEDVEVPTGAYVYQFYITDYAQNELYTEPFIIDLEE
ncbi:clostripain-related cysteine peptidase [Metabacillus litoralis]|uniref:clostripain-related cysteine peptidase n=1 Tax=Metabacillus litoralis TaxID=152268 RepID=UPI001CFEDF97|nr:clostripain-related cysteine peptidase [Metabacillus litoralis]